MAADLNAYHSALDTFKASPSETTKVGVLTERAKLPDVASGDGGSVGLPNIQTLTTMLDGLIAAASARGDQKRVIQARTSFGGLR